MVDARTKPSRLVRVGAIVGVAAAALTVSALVWRPWAERGGDTSFDTSVASPALTARAPRVIFDQGHRNTHSISGRFAPFAALLRADGCRVRASSRRFDRDALADADILVIVNACGPEAARTDSAFTPSEIVAIQEWVEGGGALLLAADHHPYGAAAAELARAFGITMVGGMCDDPANLFPGTADTGAIAFTSDRRMIGEHPITTGRDASERVATVVTFTGQSLVGPPDAAVLLRFADSAIDQVPVSSVSETVGGVTTTTFTTRDTSAAGHAQGLALERGKGRAVVVGEAAMLSAQIDQSSGLKFGMNVPDADNRRFVLNTVRWLAGELR